jgi:hypothetical protein
MRLLVLAILCFACTATFYGESRLMAPIGQAATPVFDFEPWVTSVAVGDFVVRQYPDGRTERWEAALLDASFLSVKITDIVHGKKGTHHYVKFRTKPASSSGKRKIMPPEMAKTDRHEQIEVNKQPLECSVFDGIEQHGSGSTNGIKVQLWRRAVRFVAAEVPLGGVVRELHAPLDRSSLGNATDGNERLINRGEPTELAFEVIDFGFGKRADIAKASSP